MPKNASIRWLIALAAYSQSYAHRARCTEIPFAKAPCKPADC